MIIYSELHNTTVKKNAAIPPDLYDVWLECLMQTLKEFDPEYSSEVELSWRVVLAPGITYMKFKYDQ